MLTIIEMFAGAVVMAALAVFLYVIINDYLDKRATAVRRQLVRREQRIAEARAQAVMHDTVQRMFDAVRKQP